MKLKEKTTATLLIAIFMISMILVVPAIAKKDDTRIQDGVLTYSSGHFLAGQPLMLGYDPYGYNYQAHLYNGYYCNVYLGRDGYEPFTGDVDAYLADNPGAASKWYWYPDVTLVMKWNDAWLSNMDRDDDGKLDRHYGYTSYIGSGAWETNHQWGVDEEGHWSYFVKIIAVPDDAYATAGIWYSSDDIEIGPDIWGAFAIIQEFDSGLGIHYNSPSPTGFGYYQP